MDTTEVAAHLGTTPRRLRQFLRSEGSTFKAVGSGARYDFTLTDMPALNTRFHAWNGTKAAPTMRLVTAPRSHAPQDRDHEIWAEEDAERGGPLVLDDIRRPDVRAQVRRIAKAQERRLEQRLLAVGLHITQMRVRAAS